MLANSLLLRLVRVVLSVFVVWAVARTLFAFVPKQDEVAAMVLLLCVLMTATQADRWLAVAASLAAGLSFSYYFIRPVYTFEITTTEDSISFVTFIVVALIGSHLSLRARLREEESERRRSEMARLHELGTSFLASETVAGVAGRAVREIGRLFGCSAVLKIDGRAEPFQSGESLRPADFGVVRPQVAGLVNGRDVLELYGMAPSPEMRKALFNLVGLALDKAAANEQTARVEAERRGDELRSTVLDALAHNFRTPLTCIKAAASVMRGSVEVPGIYDRDLVEVIDEEADHLDELISDALAPARIQSRQSNPQMEDCTLSSIVSTCLQKMHRYLAERLVIVEIPDDLPLVRVDRFLFGQMITQLLDNAWKYSVSGARIRISACVDGDEIILTIQNEGSQIPEAERALIFDRFFRGAGNRSLIEGTGLGLAIAQTISEALGGRLWLESEADGPAFRFALPAGMAEEHHDRESQYSGN